MSIVNATHDDASVAILELFPRQGEWRDGDYFSLPGNRMVELVHGHVEVLPGFRMDVEELFTKARAS